MGVSASIKRLNRAKKNKVALGLKTLVIKPNLNELLKDSLFK